MEAEGFCYWVSNEKKEAIFATNDLFEGLKCLRNQPVGYKLIRSEDDAVLAYTTGFKQPASLLMNTR